MAKEVTVLSLEGKFLRGLRLAESGGAFARQAAEAWSVAAEQETPPGEGAAAGEDGAGAASPAGDGTEEGGQETTAADLLAQAFHDAAAAFKTREFILSVPLSRLLVKVLRLPVDEREDLADAARPTAIFGII